MGAQVLKAGVLYFALVFGAGFVLGTIRTLWVVPRVGTRMAELTETPIMLAVVIVASRWVALHLLVPFVPSVRLGMGAIALGLLLLAEFAFVLWVRGLSIRQYFASGDRVSGAVAICNHAAPRGSKTSTTPRNKDSSRDFADTSAAADD
jgi:hypothetical protein